MGGSIGRNNANATFLLVSHETANVLDAKVGSTGYSAPHTWSAGQVGYFSSGAIVCVDGSAANTSKFRVLYCNKNTNSDETVSSGSAAYVSGPHVGRTTQFESDITSATDPGTALFVATTGKFTLTGGGSKVTNCPVLGTVRWCDGVWLEYEWNYVGSTPTS